MNIEQEVGLIVQVLDSLVDERIKTEKGETLVHHLNGNPDHQLVVGNVRYGKKSPFDKTQPTTTKATTFVEYLNKKAAFREWILVLPKGSKLPRGKFFRPKPKKLMFIDEAWSLLK